MLTFRTMTLVCFLFCAGSFSLQAADAPAVYQTAKTQVADKIPAKDAKDEIAAEKPKVFIPNSNLSATSIKIPSLKDVSKTREAQIEEEDPYIKGTAKDDYTPDQFSKCWSDFAAMLKADGKKNALTIFISNPPKLTGPCSYEIIVENVSHYCLALTLKIVLSIFGGSFSG